MEDTTLQNPVETSGAPATPAIPPTQAPAKPNQEKQLQDSILSGNVPQMVLLMISYALELRSSDIHIEPLKNTVRLRYRVDGVLRQIIEYPPNLHPAVVSRIKIMSNLKIDEQRIPQDGRCGVTTGDNREMDLRVSTLPSVHGEKIVMRLQDKSRKIPDLPELGIEGLSLKYIEEGLAQPNGIILTTGPTGSGKTTTLYSALNRLNTIGVNILTIEDPVEISLDGLNQSQVHPEIQYTFATGLRSALRQDPDIIMVGEIRDRETIDTAIEASLTGHLVLSTIHTNSAIETITRIDNMGVPPFLMASTLEVVIAQRLVRKICQDCKQKTDKKGKHHEQAVRALKHLNKKAEIEKDLVEKAEFYEAPGCDKCEGVGYFGRVGLYEVMRLTNKIRRMIIERKSAIEVEKTAIAEGMVTLEQAGIMKALKGETTLEEVYRVARVIEEYPETSEASFTRHSPSEDGQQSPPPHKNTSSPKQPIPPKMPNKKAQDFALSGAEKYTLEAAEPNQASQPAKQLEDSPFFEIDKSNEAIHQISTTSIYTKLTGHRLLDFYKNWNDYLVSKGRIKPKEIATFFRLLAIMLNAGVPLIKSLDTLSIQAKKNPKLKKIVFEMARAVEQGSSLSQSLSIYTEVFTEAQIGMIKSGEVTGQLNSILIDLAHEAENSAKIASKTKSAMIYPAVLLTIMIGVIIVMMVMVLPQMSDLFLKTGQELPLITTALIAASDAMVNYGLYILAAIGGIIMAIIAFTRTTQGHYLWDKLKLHLPIFGNIFRKTSLAKFSSSLGNLLASGITIVQSLQIVSKAVGNDVYKQLLLFAAEDLKKGIPLAENLSGSKYFPQMLVNMIEVGEQTAQLETVTKKIANYYNDEVDTIVSSLTKIMEPLLITIIGVMVGGLVAAIMLPIMQLTEFAGA